MSSRVIKSATHRQPLGCHHVPILFSNTLVAVQKLTTLFKNIIFEKRRQFLNRPVDKHSVNWDKDKWKARAFLMNFDFCIIRKRAVE